MKIKIKGIKEVAIRGEYIKLDSLIKYVSEAGTGGEAKMLIQEGEVKINGEECRQRGRKVRQGDIVRIGRRMYKVRDEKWR